jgi:hypothetical protein
VTADAVVLVSAADLRSVLEQLHGHDHLRPGIWDGSDGRPCVECAARERLTAALSEG